MERLTALVTCYNEEAMLLDCLASLRFADEILVVDSFSTDRSPVIARERGAQVLRHEYLNPAAQKNWAIPQASHPWVLILDSDERVTPELAEEIKTILRAPGASDGYWIRRKNYFWGKQIRHGAWSKDKVLRLFRRDLGRYQDKQVHEEIEIERFSGPPGWCENRLEHFSYRSLEDFLRKISRYGNWGAVDANAKGIKSSAWKIWGHSTGPFLNSYLLKQGFRDGTEGLIIAFMEAYYSFFKYSRLYEMQRVDAADKRSR